MADMTARVSILGWIAHLIAQMIRPAPPAVDTTHPQHRPMPFFSASGD